MMKRSDLKGLTMNGKAILASLGMTKQDNTHIPVACGWMSVEQIQAHYQGNNQNSKTAIA